MERKGRERKKENGYQKKNIEENSIEISAFYGGNWFGFFI
jgi:hypothetical protein